MNHAPALPRIAEMGLPCLMRSIAVMITRFIGRILYPINGLGRILISRIFK
jgi:hypothetical protein